MKSTKLTEAQKKVDNFYMKQYDEAKEFLFSVWNKEDYNKIDIPKKYYNEYYGCKDSKAYFRDLVHDENKSIKFIKKYKDNLTAMAYYHVFSIQFNVLSISTLYSKDGTWIEMEFN